MHSGGATAWIQTLSVICEYHVRVTTLEDVCGRIDPTMGEERLGHWGQMAQSDIFIEVNRGRVLRRRHVVRMSFEMR